MKVRTETVVIACLICFVLGMGFGDYLSKVSDHNQKTEYLIACGNLEHNMTVDQCTIMWYSRGAAH